MLEKISRIVRIHEFGWSEVLQIETAMVASPSPDQACLAIGAIGLNRTEVTLRSGRSP
jgi:NADPH:quinone reductase-like Zn-dependent oxidoreductase